MSDLQMVIDNMEKSHIPASGTTSERDLIIQKAFLEGRIRQICQYIQARIPNVDFIGDRARLRLEEHKHHDKLCKDYQLYSPNLDGSIQEILEKVEDMAESDGLFLSELVQREEDELKILVAQVKEILEQLLPLRRKKSVWEFESLDLETRRGAEKHTESAQLKCQRAQSRAGQREDSSG